MNKAKRMRLIRNIVIDLIITGIALVVFALFHHVLPRAQQSVGIAIPNPYSLEEGGFDLASMLVPSATAEGIGISSSTAVAARGSGKSGRGGMNQKGGSALGSLEDQDIDDTADMVPISEKFAEMYTDEIVQTENSYSSPDISIKVSEEFLDNGRITYYIADIYLRNVTCFQTVLAGNTYGTGYRDDISAMARMQSALVAVNGDYYGNTNEGVVIRNGMVYRANRTYCDICMLCYDGTMRVIPGSTFTIEDAIEYGAWQAWTFGPALLDYEGNTIQNFSSTGRIIAANPRTAIGYYEPGHYCLVVVDGRGDSAGITLPEFSELFSSLGCKMAYNLDGGNSSIMVWNGSVINDPSGGGRESSDAVVIAEVI